MKHAETIPVVAVCAIMFSFLPRPSGAEGFTDVDWLGISTNVAANGRGAYPDLARFMEGIDLGSRSLESAFSWIDELEGRDVLSPGDPHLLASTRGILARLLDYDGRYDKFNTVFRGFVYLAKRGDARDIPLFEKYQKDPLRRQLDSKLIPLTPEQKELRALRQAMSYLILQHRVAGTNIVLGGTFDWSAYPYHSAFQLPRDMYSTNDLHFIPSVANTGPQAAYVYAALEQAVKKALAQETVNLMEGTEIERDDSYDDSPYAMITNIAPELLTMRVWFDADGEAVCDVDLAKYGIFVPGLRVAGSSPPASPPQGQPPSPAIAAISGADVTEPATAPPPRSRLAIPLAFGVGILIALGVLAALRKKSRQ